MIAATANHAPHIYALSVLAIVYGPALIGAWIVHRSGRRGK